MSGTTRRMLIATPSRGLPEGERARRSGTVAEIHDRAVLDDARELPAAGQRLDGSAGITLEHADVRQLARLEHAHLALEADREGVAAGGPDDRFHRREAAVGD